MAAFQAKPRRTDGLLTARLRRLARQPLADWPSWIARDCSSGGNIARDDTSSAYNCIVADGYAWKDDRAAANPGIRADRHWPAEAYFLASQIGVARVIRGEDLCARTNGSSCVDDDRLHIEDDAVEVQKGIGAKRDVGPEVAEERWSDHGVVTNRSEPLGQQ